MDVYSFFFNDTATTEIYTLSLHDALPISPTLEDIEAAAQQRVLAYDRAGDGHYDTVSAFIKSLRGNDPDAALYWLDRKSTRLNSSHANISYAVFCLKKKKNISYRNIRHL